jgi:hypothetical protein
MAIDFDAIKKRLASLSGQNSKQKLLWKPPEGETTTVRLVAFPDNDGTPFQERYFYYGIEKYGILAPYQFGKPDPVNELIQSLKSEGTKESYELAKKLYPKMRTYALVVVRGEEDQGLRVWSFGKGIYMDLMKTMMDPDYGDITDVNEGFDIKITVTKTPGKKWADTSIMPRPKQTPLGTKKEIAKFMDNVPDLNDLYELSSYETIENSVNKWLNGGAQDPWAKNDDTTGSTNSDPKNNKPVTEQNSNSSVSTADNDLDSAFGDLEEEFPF